MHIIAMSSGVLKDGPGATLLKDYILGLVCERRPRVAFVPTATGDSAEAIVSFYSTFPPDRYEPSHLTLFSRTIEDLRAYVLRQQIVYVQGGNTANLLAVWRTQGLDEIFREAWHAGVVLCGSSAGALCWFESGITDSFGPTLAPLDNGLGFLGGSFCPHYDSEPGRRPTFHRAVAEGLSGGYACEDGTALHFEGTELAEVVSGSADAKVYRVEHRAGDVEETPLSPRLLV